MGAVPVTVRRSRRLSGRNGREPDVTEAFPRGFPVAERNVTTGNGRNGVTAKGVTLRYFSFLGENMKNRKEPRKGAHIPLSVTPLRPLLPLTEGRA